MEKTTTNLFEMATRKKFRFPYKGMISVEDLWDLSVENLDTVYKTLNAEAKRANEDSLLATKSAEDTVLDMKIAIVKHIVGVKLDEKAKRQEAATIAAEKRKLMEIIANKQDEALNNMSVEELEAKLAALG